jgi:NADH:ubiquinone oxidoreductase subunit F (NADH-binding)
MSTTQSVPTLPRLLAGITADGPMSLEQHLAMHGPAPFARGRRARREASELIERVDRAGLRGRGGAGFPTATKLRAVAGAHGRPIVVANGSEGEPLSLKDRLLLERLPQLVLDGGLLAAQALGADELIVAVDESADVAQRSLARALTERAHEPGARTLAPVQIATVPDRYVAGQESALVSHLNGGPALPTFTPPLVFERGVRRRPTFVSNVETLAHLALIARYGSRWFRQLGTEAHPGTALSTLSGAVGYPGVYEIEHGARLEQLLDAAGGATEPLRAVLVGGYAGAWIPAAAIATLELDSERLAEHGAALGAGVIMALSEQSCGVAETARIARWMSEQSAGQCGPCVNGLRSIANEFEQIRRGLAGPRALQRIARWATLTRGRGACGHPDGAIRLIASALTVFEVELADHARHGPCAACAEPSELPLPALPSPALRSPAFATA